MLELGHFEGCPPVRGRPWQRGGPHGAHGGGPRVGRGRASSLPAEFCREAAAVTSLEAASLESLVGSLQGKERFYFRFLLFASLFSLSIQRQRSPFGSRTQYNVMTVR